MNEYYFGYKTLCTVRQYIKSKIGIDDKYTFKGSAQTEAIQVVEVTMRILHICPRKLIFYLFYRIS